MTNPDVPLGASVDVAPELTPETFDVTEWLAGVRPTRRAVTLYASGHVLARMDQIADRINRLPNGAEVDELVAEFEELKAQFLDGRTFVIEGRSSEWRGEFTRVAKERLGMKGDGTPEQRRTVMLEMLAEQMVSPVVTVEQLDRLGDANEGELSKLLVAQTFANEQLAEASAVVTLDFSSRRSGASRS